MDDITLLREFRADVEECDELTEARAKAVLRAEIAAGTKSAHTRVRVARPRWVRVAAVAVVVGGGLGFGFATWLSPSAPATSSFVGFGFLPAKGWTVMESGTLDETATASAVTANVPLDPADALGAPPSATLESLPQGGVVVFATFAARGDPAADAGFVERALPLRIADATSALKPFGPRPLAEYRLRAGVEGYNVDVRIYFGAAAPSPAVLAAAQQQLNRLVVAAERVTLFARPTILGDQAVELFGSIDSGKAGEVVDVQAKDCGQKFFRGVVGATTRQGGGWSTDYFPAISTTFRAVWNGTASDQITVRQRASVRLSRLPFSSQFEVAVVGRRQFWHRRAVIQRFDRRLGRWLKVKSVLLTNQDAAGSFIWTSARFTTSLPKGTLIRAHFPLAQARPCYLAGVSRQLGI